MMALRAAGAGAVAAAFYYLWFVWRRSNVQFRQKFSQGSDVTAVVDERGITLATGVDRKTHLWVGFSRIYESKRVIVMEKGGDDFIYLPRSAMDAAQLAELKRLTANTVGCKVAIAPPLG